MAARIIDMTGKRYGDLTALRIVGPSKSRGLLWLFSCACGAHVEAAGNEVRRGGVLRCPSCADKKRLAAVTTHGRTESPEYANWCAMKARCLNPAVRAYADYGGRGITVCERWASSFEAFLSDMGPRPSRLHTVERDDHNGHYEPSNCRWATRAEQANNKRNNRRIEIDGVVHTLSQWAAISGITESGMRGRLRRGVTGAALLSPSPSRN